MTEEILCTGPVRDVAALIKAGDFPRDAYFLAERLPQQVIVDPQERQDLLRFARLHEVIDDNVIADYTSGRVFDQDFELRWEKDADGGYKVVYLGKERSIPGLEKDDKELKKLDRSKLLKHYYLFGEYLNKERLESMGIEPEEGYYAEVRIPRLLRYPALKGARRVQLTVCEYIDKETGRVGLFRFQGLQPAE